MQIFVKKFSEEEIFSEPAIFDMFERK